LFGKQTDITLKKSRACRYVTAEEMDRLDEALRCTIKKLWPIEGKKIHATLIPPNDGRCSVERH